MASKPHEEWKQKSEQVTCCTRLSPFYPRPSNTPRGKFLGEKEKKKKRRKTPPGPASCRLSSHLPPCSLKAAKQRIRLERRGLLLNTKNIEKTKFHFGGEGRSNFWGKKKKEKIFVPFFKNTKENLFPFFRKKLIGVANLFVEENESTS